MVECMRTLSDVLPCFVQFKGESFCPGANIIFTLHINKSKQTQPATDVLDLVSVTVKSPINRLYVHRAVRVTAFI